MHVPALTLGTIFFLFKQLVLRFLYAKKDACLSLETIPILPTEYFIVRICSQDPHSLLKTERDDLFKTIALYYVYYVWNISGWLPFLTNKTLMSIYEQWARFRISHLKLYQ